MKLNYTKDELKYSLNLSTVKSEGSNLDISYNNKVHYTPVTHDNFSNSTDMKFSHNNETLSVGFVDMTISNDNSVGECIINYGVGSTIIGSNGDDTLYINGDRVVIDPQNGNDIININADYVTLCASDDNKLVNYRGSDGIIEFYNSDSTISYGDYKIDFKDGTDFNTFIDGSDVLFYNEHDTLKVVGALGKKITVKNYNSIEETVLSFDRDIRHMLTYNSDLTEVTLNGTAQIADTSKTLFEGDCYRGDYTTSTSSILVAAGANGDKGFYLEGNAKNNLIVIESGGNYSIDSGIGNDTISLYSGNSNDYIIYRNNQGNDVVYNFNSTQDKIQVLDFVEGETEFKITVDNNNDITATIGNGSIKLINPFANTNDVKIDIIGGDNREIKSINGYEFTNSFSSQLGYVTLKSNATGYVIQPGDTYIDATAAQGQLTFDATQTNRSLLIEGFKSNDKIIGFDLNRLSESSYEEGKITLGLDGKKFVLQTVSSNALNINDSISYVDENMLMNNSKPSTSNNFFLAGKNEGFNSSDYGINYAVTINGAITTGDISISGSTGNELLIGGKGSGTITGGDGSDTFLINVINNKTNIITDLAPSQDQVSLNPVDIHDLHYVAAEEGNVTLQFDEGSVVLQNLSLPTSVTINNENYTFGEGTLFNLDTKEVTFYYPITLNVSSDPLYSGYNIFNAIAGGSLKAGSETVTLKGSNVTLDGDSANDTFVVEGEYNVLRNFTPETDQISLASNDMNNIKSITFIDEGLELSFNNNEKVFLENFDKGYTATIDGSSYLFEEDLIMNITTGSITFLTPVSIDLSTDAVYSNATYINARSGGYVKAGPNAVTLTGANAILEGASNSDTFIYNGNDITIRSYADNDRISLAPGYIFNDKTDFVYEHDIRKLVLTIKDKLGNDGTITFENLAQGTNIEYWQTPVNSTEAVSKTDDFTIDYRFSNRLSSAEAVSVTIYTHYGDFGVIGDSLGSGDPGGAAEYYTNLVNITAAKENTTLTGNKNNNSLYVKGGERNVITCGLGNDNIIFYGGGGIITSFGAGKIKNANKTTLAGTPRSTSYNRTDPSTYKQGLDRLKLYGTLKNVAYETHNTLTESKVNPSFAAYVIYTADNDGKDYVIKLDNIYKIVTNYTTGVYKTDQAVAKAFYICDTSINKDKLQQRTDVANLLSNIEDSPYKNLIQEFEEMIS